MDLKGLGNDFKKFATKIGASDVEEGARQIVDEVNNTLAKDEKGAITVKELDRSGAMNGGGLSLMDTLLRLSTAEFCNFNNKMGAFMDRLMKINVAEKKLTLDNPVNDAYLFGDSDQMPLNAKRYSYTEGINYLDTVKGMRDGEKDGFNTTRGFYPDGAYEEIKNLYPDDLSNGNGEFSSAYKWTFNTKDSLLYKTKELFKQGKINSIISRFGTNADGKSNDLHYTGSKRTKYGESRGRNLLKNSAEHSLSNFSYSINGYNNPYCRVWTHHYQYDKYYKTIRPFVELDRDGKYRGEKKLADFHNWYDFNLGPGEDDQIMWKHGDNGWDMSVLDTSKGGDGIVKIAPKFLGGGMKNIHTKDCMFSIENLAWKDYDPFSFEKALSWEQRGPMGGRIMWFPPYGIQFNESTNVKWNANTFIGRGEDVYTYVNTTRTGNLSFLMVVDHPSIIDYAEWHNDTIEETDLLRFFAGCDSLDPSDNHSIMSKLVPTPLTDEYTLITPVKVEDEEQKVVTHDPEPIITKDPDPEEVPPENGPETVTVKLKVFFPNDYSGVFDGPEDALVYMLLGCLTQLSEFKDNNLPLMDFTTLKTKCNGVHVSDNHYLPRVNFGTANNMAFGYGYEISFTMDFYWSPESLKTKGRAFTSGNKRWQHRIDRIIDKKYNQQTNSYFAKFGGIDGKTTAEAYSNTYKTTTSLIDKGNPEIGALYRDECIINGGTPPLNNKYGEFFRELGLTNGDLKYKIYEHGYDSDISEVMNKVTKPVWNYGNFKGDVIDAFIKGNDKNKTIEMTLIDFMFLCYLNESITDKGWITSCLQQCMSTIFNIEDKDKELFPGILCLETKNDGDIDAVYWNKEKTKQESTFVSKDELSKLSEFAITDIKIIDASHSTPGNKIQNKALKKFRGQMTAEFVKLIVNNDKISVTSEAAATSESTSTKVTSHDPNVMDEKKKRYGEVEITFKRQQRSSSGASGGSANKTVTEVHDGDPKADDAAETQTIDNLTLVDIVTALENNETSTKYNIKQICGVNFERDGGSTADAKIVTSPDTLNGYLEINGTRQCIADTGIEIIQGGNVPYDVILFNSTKYCRSTTLEITQENEGGINDIIRSLMSKGKMIKHKINNEDRWFDEIIFTVLMDPYDTIYMGIKNTKCGSGFIQEFNFYSKTYHNNNLKIHEDITPTSATTTNSAPRLTNRGGETEDENNTPKKKEFRLDVTINYPLWFTGYDNNSNLCFDYLMYGRPAKEYTDNDDKWEMGFFWDKDIEWGFCADSTAENKVGFQFNKVLHHGDSDGQTSSTRFIVKVNYPVDSYLFTNLKDAGYIFNNTFKYETKLNDVNPVVLSPNEDFNWGKLQEIESAQLASNYVRFVNDKNQRGKCADGSDITVSDNYARIGLYEFYILKKYLEDKTGKEYTKLSQWESLESNSELENIEVLGEQLEGKKIKSIAVSKYVTPVGGFMVQDGSRCSRTAQVGEFADCFTKNFVFSMENSTQTSNGKASETGEEIIMNRYKCQCYESGKNNGVPYALWKYWGKYDNYDQNSNCTPFTTDTTDPLNSNKVNEDYANFVKAKYRDLPKNNIESGQVGNGVVGRRLKAIIEFLCGKNNTVVRGYPKCDVENNIQNYASVTYEIIFSDEEGAPVDGTSSSSGDNEQNNDDATLTTKTTDKSTSGISKSGSDKSRLKVCPEDKSTSKSGGDKSNGAYDYDDIYYDPSKDPKVEVKDNSSSSSNDNTVTTEDIEKPVDEDTLFYEFFEPNFSPNIEDKVEVFNTINFCDSFRDNIKAWLRSTEGGGNESAEWSTSETVSNGKKSRIPIKDKNKLLRHINEFCATDPLMPFQAFSAEDLQLSLTGEDEDKTIMFSNIDNSNCAKWVKTVEAVYNALPKEIQENIGVGKEIGLTGTISKLLNKDGFIKLEVTLPDGVTQSMATMWLNLGDFTPSGNKLTLMIDGDTLRTTCGFFNLCNPSDFSETDCSVVVLKSGQRKNLTEIMTVLKSWKMLLKYEIIGTLFIPSGKVIDTSADEGIDEVGCDNMTLAVQDGNDIKTLNATSELKDRLLDGSQILSREKERNVVRYDQEYYFFKALQKTDRLAYTQLIDKIKYFDPAFHSMTPEGFNARLTFLNQCTRQGNTRTVADPKGQTANNLAFGRPPFCVLRIGDFYNQMIVINSVNIDYSVSDGIQWDMNTEGIGMQPLLARVDISFNFIGGGDIAGPIRRLQNAMTFNYYANTRFYDNRADRVVYNTDSMVMGALGFDKPNTSSSYSYTTEVFDKNNLKK